MSRKKPAHQRRAEGNPGKRPIPEEPDGIPGRPALPATLADNMTARIMFETLSDRLEEMGALYIADGPILEIAAAAYAEWVKLSEVIEKEGHTYKAETQHGYRRLPLPEVAQMQSAWNRYEKALGKCGLTPADRSRLTIHKREDPDEFAKLIG